MSKIKGCKKFDMHTHSNNSHDGQFSVDDMAKNAKMKSVDGICITDHCDLFLAGIENVEYST